MHTILEQNSSSIIIALSDTEIGKVILPNTMIWVDAKTKEPSSFFNSLDKPTHERDMEALKQANTINSLLPAFIRSDTWQADDGTIHKMIVMERLYALPIHHFDTTTRTLMMVAFEAQMKELHDNFFVHGDFCRPTNYMTRGNYEWMFKNIVQTAQGLRLIDTGFSKYIPREKDTKTLVHCLIDEQDDIKVFRRYYLEIK